MALYRLSMLEIAMVLSEEDPADEEVAIKFFDSNDHLAGPRTPLYIRRARGV